jgi:hypothetical protein
MDETSLIIKILSCHRIVHDEPGVKPSLRVRIECETEAGPLALIATTVAANQLVTNLRHLRDKEKEPATSP